MWQRTFEQMPGLWHYAGRAGSLQVVLGFVFNGGTTQAPVGSRTGWQLDGIVNLWVQGDGKTWDYRQNRYRQYTQQHPEGLWWLGTGPVHTDTLSSHSTDILSHWSHCFDGGFSYWNNFANNYTTATGSDSGGDATIRM